MTMTITPTSTPVMPATMKSSPSSRKSETSGVLSTDGIADAIVNRVLSVSPPLASYSQMEPLLGTSAEFVISAFQTSWKRNSVHFGSRFSPRTTNRIPVFSNVGSCKATIIGLKYLSHVFASFYTMGEVEHHRMQETWTLNRILRRPLEACYSVFPALRCVNQYRRTFGRMPNILNPRTFNEKTIRKKLFDRNPRLTLFQDKLLARRFVESRLGSDKYLPQLYAVSVSPQEIRHLHLPTSFVMKPSHLSGDIKIVYDSRSIVDGELDRLSSKWLRQNLYKLSGEWAYKNIRPRIMFEELLNLRGSIPDDFKFFCFRGEPRFLEVHKRRFVDHRCNFYDLNLTLLPVRQKSFLNFEEEQEVPPGFEEMLEVCRMLSKGVDFVRVDLYNIDGRILFGEFANYPGGGCERFEPPTWDLKFGGFWN